LTRLQAMIEAPLTPRFTQNLWHPVNVENYAPTCRPIEA
jgi:hypothetical protein